MERCESCGADLVEEANYCILCGDAVATQNQVAQEVHSSLDKNFVKEAKLVFFESGAELPPQDKREYSDKFLKNEVRYINFTVKLRHNSTEIDRNIELTHSIYGPDDTARLLTTGKDEFVVSASSSSSNHTLGCGWEMPGNWQPGQYFVTISMDEDIVADGTFNIY